MIVDLVGIGTEIGKLKLFKSYGRIKKKNMTFTHHLSERRLRYFRIVSNVDEHLLPVLFIPSFYKHLLFQFSILSTRAPVHPTTEMSIVNMQLIINTNYYCAERIRLHPNHMNREI